jgi:ABC-type branched-subunit amino acid transport system ATPase component/ABC-type branched-subunit amino acid transport system permease subunit
MTTRAILIAAVVVAGIVASPFTGFIPGWSPALVTVVALHALSLLGLNLIFGVVGMLAFGQAAFMALPGYSAALFEQMGVPFFAAVIAGLVTTVLIARLMAEVFVRLPGAYLAVGTLGFGFVVEGLARAFPNWTGGASGLVFERGRDIGAAAWYVIAMAALAIALATYGLHVRGAVWRRLRTIRHDELAAAVLGIDVGREKARAFTVGSAYAAVGGLLLAYYVGVLVPEDAGVSRSLEQIGTVLLGGAGYLVGPLVGTSLVDWLFVVAGYGARYELAIYGVAFLAVVMYAPHGIVGWLARPWRWLAGSLQEEHSSRRSSVQSASLQDRSREGVCLSVGSISKRFGGVQALDHVSFEVTFGEIFALVGPNGAGKTTLFNIVSGIISATEGTIRLSGQDLAAVPIYRRAPFIGRSFQVARLVPELSTRANVMVRIDRIAPHLGETERAAFALQQLEAFGLAELAEHPVRELSLGQHKLIDLARAAVGDPPLVLLDEPAVGLTKDELSHLATMIEKLRAGRSTVLIVEHNIDFIASIATRGLVLDGGRPIASGPIAQILTDPKVQDAYFGALQ